MSNALKRLGLSTMPIPKSIQIKYTGISNIMYLQKIIIYLKLSQTSFI